MKATQPDASPRPGHSPDAVYLDHNASAPLLPEARAAMMAAWEAYPGNPSSPHGFGQAARDALESARAQLAEWIGFHRREIVFTSGGTESNNTILRQSGLGRRGGHVITSAIEHPSVLESCAWLERQGVPVDYLPVDGSGVVAVEALAALIRPDTRLVSVMAANNETGAVQPIAELVRTLREAQGERHIPFHCDAVQAFGRIPMPPDAWGVDALTLAAHKLGGPKGIGVLALRETSGAAGAAEFEGLVLGGRQERGRRAGTESVALAEGFRAAAQKRLAELEPAERRMAGLRDRLEAGLVDLPGCFVNAKAAPRLPNTLNVGFSGISAQSLLISLDLHGIAVSTGSACSSGAVEPSHVLQAMGLSEARLNASLRISLGQETDPEEIETAVRIIRNEVMRLSGRGKAAS